VGRNYAEHAKERGSEVDREAPWYFTKPANAIVLSGTTIAYPPETKNYHYEMELVIAIGAPVFRVSVADASPAVFGYACGPEMTRRDLQIASREKSRPGSRQGVRELRRDLGSHARSEIFTDRPSANLPKGWWCD
jgi:fumarylpyruvate hydrolase